ncbi:MAG: glycosyltransferase, partial [Alphaproteobacteria bacterium]
VVLEAAAAGMPLIATKVGGIPEITANTSCDLIPPDDPAALGRRLRHFLEDPDRFVAEAEELRARVAQRFTIERMADSITRFYRRLLRTSR